MYIAWVFVLFVHDLNDIKNLHNKNVRILMFVNFCISFNALLEYMFTHYIVLENNACSFQLLKKLNNYEE